MNRYSLNANPIVSADFIDEDGDAADPTTVTLVVTKPDATTATYTNVTLDNPAVGTWSKTLVANQAGTWSYTFTGTGAVAAAGSGRFEVGPGTNLASVEDLETLLRRTFSNSERDAAELILAGVSAAIRRVTDQTISLVEEDEITIDREGCWRTLWLPERPVVSIDSVTVDGALVSAECYRVDGGSAQVTFSRPLGTWGTPSAFEPQVQVIYAHGFDPVPDDVVSVCLDASVRAFQNPEGSIVAADGSAGFTAGRTLAGSLSKDEEHRLRAAYRPPITSVPIVASSAW